MFRNAEFFRQHSSECSNDLRDKTINVDHRETEKGHQIKKIQKLTRFISQKQFCGFTFTSNTEKQQTQQWKRTSQVQCHRHILKTRVISRNKISPNWI